LAERLDAVGKDILDTLTTGVGPRPELEILDPIVGTVAISMMDDLASPQRPAEVESHN
jgi:hypothetical protein